MKKMFKLLIVGAFVFILGACGKSNDQTKASSESDEQLASSSEILIESEEEIVESSEIEESKSDDAWYSDDSTYSTLEPIRKTVEMQMEELGTDDPVKAIVVNAIQNYLYDSGIVALDTELTANDIDKKLDYSRNSLIIDIKYDGSEPSKDMANSISEQIYDIAGKNYTIE